MDNRVETFFDGLANTWDKSETCPREFKLSLLSELGIAKGDKVLDLACGTGVVTGLIHELSDTEVVGVDISNNMIEVAKEKYNDEEWATFVHADFLNWDTDITFDDVVIYNAYPHFLEPMVLSKKLASVLNKGGRVAILHSLSRKDLCSHHSGRAISVSRNLMELSREVDFFKNEFDVITSKEDDKSIVIILQKR
ncbi:MAG: class I SAM-dependent methyltransferase [Bacilli bacterium]|nr:class I SAM-dependent methyltransferase [Bacilli bacterium]